MRLVELATNTYAVYIRDSNGVEHFLAICHLTAETDTLCGSAIDPTIKM